MAEVSFLRIVNDMGMVVAEAKLMLSVDPEVALEIYERYISGDASPGIDPRHVLREACRSDIPDYVAIDIRDGADPANTTEGDLTASPRRRRWLFGSRS